MCSLFSCSSSKLTLILNHNLRSCIFLNLLFIILNFITAQIPVKKFIFIAHSIVSVNSFGITFVSYSEKIRTAMVIFFMPSKIAIEPTTQSVVNCSRFQLAIRSIRSMMFPFSYTLLDEITEFLKEVELPYVLLLTSIAQIVILVQVLLAGLYVLGNTHD